MKTKKKLMIIYDCIKITIIHCYLEVCVDIHVLAKIEHMISILLNK